MAHPILKGKYFALLASLVMLGVLYPLLAGDAGGHAVWTVGFWLVLYGGQHAVGSHRYVRVVTGALAFSVLATGTAVLAFGYTTASPLLQTLLSVASLAFLGVTTIVVLGDVLGPDRVDVDKILGAVCVYVLLGLSFAFAFVVLAAITDTPAIAPTPKNPIADYLYFSFTSLTTLGYGDFAPKGPAARLFATGEALTGQIYLTILVARLVGLHLLQAGDEPEATGEATRSPR